MTARNYWLDLFSHETWTEFLAAGGEVSGFRLGRRSQVKKIQPGDYLLCYLTGVSRWVGVLEVQSPAYEDTTPLWSASVFPVRLKVKSIAKLTAGTGIPVLEMREQLSVFTNLKNPNIWSGAFRGSPTKWSAADGEFVVNAVLEAQEHPRERPLDRAKLARRPFAVETPIGAVTLPEPGGDQDEAEDESPADVAVEQKQQTAHTEIQWLLLKLGSDMGHSVWVARGDRNRDWQGQRFADVPHFRSDLPRQFDDATNRIVEQIDVLWLKGNSIAAAFEIESTTSIYSGLLRMSDLLVMQPNLNIPLFIVAPDERRSKVIHEVNRPTFARLPTPMVDICRYISFSGLRTEIERISRFAQYLKPEFLQEISESCEAEGPA